MFRSAAYIVPFYDRSLAAVSKSFANVELVFVNDGSPDDSLAVAIDLSRKDARVRVIDLSRNYGHHRAMIAGLEHARGNLVFLIDCDLEEPPEIFEDLYDTIMSAPDIDAAYGVQVRRKGRSVERLGGALAYSIINAMAGELHLEPNMLVARVMTRRFVDAMISHRETEVVFSGLVASAGFKQVGVPVHKLSKGSTVYSIRRRVSMLIRGITAFSDRPLIYISYLGVIILLASLVFITFQVVAYFFYRTVPEGYTSIAISIWFLGGLILLAIGIVAQYMAIIFAEVKHRPRYVVRAIHQQDQTIEP